MHLKVDRNGQTLDLPVTLSEFDLEAENKGEGEGNLPERRREGRPERLVGPGPDARTPPATADPRRNAGVVITDLDPDSAVGRRILPQQGDIIVQVDRKPVTTVSEFNAAVRAGASRESTLLLVKRGQGTHFVVVPNK